MNAFLSWVAVALVAFVLYMSAIIASLARQQKIAQKSGMVQDHFVILKNSWDWKWYCFLWNFVPWNRTKSPTVWTRCQYLRALMLKPLGLPILGSAYLLVAMCFLCLATFWSVCEFCWRTILFRAYVPNGVEMFADDGPGFFTYRPVSKLRGLGLWPLLVLWGLWLRYNHQTSLIRHDLKWPAIILLAGIVIFFILILTKTDTAQMAGRVIKDVYRKICPLVDVIDDPRARNK